MWHLSAGMGSGRRDREIGRKTVVAVSEGSWVTRRERSSKEGRRKRIKGTRKRRVGRRLWGLW